MPVPESLDSCWGAGEGHQPFGNEETKQEQEAYPHVPKGMQGPQEPMVPMKDAASAATSLVETSRRSAGEAPRDEEGAETHVPGCAVSQTDHKSAEVLKATMAVLQEAWRPTLACERLWSIRWGRLRSGSKR